MSTGRRIETTLEDLNYAWQHMEQMEAMKEAHKEQEKSSTHLKITPYQENEDIQYFLETFEGIMGIQEVKETIGATSYPITQWQSKC